MQGHRRGNRRSVAAQRLDRRSLCDRVRGGDTRHDCRRASSQRDEVQCHAHGVAGRASRQEAGWTSLQSTAAIGCEGATFRRSSPPRANAGPSPDAGVRCAARRVRETDGHGATPAGSSRRRSAVATRVLQSPSPRGGRGRPRAGQRRYRCRPRRRRRWHGTKRIPSPVRGPSPLNLASPRDAGGRSTPDARHDAGFVRGCVCLVDPLTLVNISVWSSRRSMLLWAGKRLHLLAVQSTYRGVEVWSADWSLRHTSPSASEWNGSLADLVPGSHFPRDPRDGKLLSIGRARTEA